MGDPILSQAEINALLKQGSPVDDGRIQELLSAAAAQTVEHFRVLIPEAVEMEGPYIEQVEEPLDVLFSENLFVIPVNVGISDLFILVSASDAEGLTKHM